MLVSISQDRCGFTTVTPVNDRIRIKYRKHLRKFDSPSADGTLFIQDNGAEELSLTPSQTRDLEAGWTIKVRMDEWTYATMLGYDANTIAR